MKFTLSVKKGEEFINVGFARPTKSGRAWQLTIFADKADLLPKSQCGKFLNALLVEDKRPERGNPFGGSGAE